MRGFPVTGVVDTAGTGTPIPSGQRSNNRPGGGEIPWLGELKSRCKDINMTTIRKAKARCPKTAADQKLAEETWEKMLADTVQGRAGPPIELEEFEMDKGLLVDTFGIYECHGEALDSKVRVINNFKGNFANYFAWMPSKLRYNGFSELREAAGIIKQDWAEELIMGKADFKSAFKTLPVSLDQSWLGWALVFCPEDGKLKGVPLYIQSFGSLGAVVAWYRTAMLVQQLMQTLFGTIFF